MISDERLEEIAFGDDWFSPEIKEMAKELLALRNALEGWKLVPIEITQEMVDANFEGVCKGGIHSGYRAMLAAAPEPE